MWSSALSTSASGQGSPYFSSRSFSRLPALTPMRIAQPLALAALTTSRTLSAEPEEEVRVGYEILKGLGIRNRGVRVVSCPSCARQGFDVIRTVQTLEERLQHIRTPMSLSVLGCVVNGPGEARETDIGITGGGQGKHMVYLSGVTDHHVQDAGMIDHIVKLVEAKAAEIESEMTDAGQADPAVAAE